VRRAGGAEAHTRKDGRGVEKTAPVAGCQQREIEGIRGVSCSGEDEERPRCCDGGEGQGSSDCCRRRRLPTASCYCQHRSVRLKTSEEEESSRSRFVCTFGCSVFLLIEIGSRKDDWTWGTEGKWCQLGVNLLAVERCVLLQYS